MVQRRGIVDLGLGHRRLKSRLGMACARCAQEQRVESCCLILGSSCLRCPSPPLFDVISTEPEGMESSQIPFMDKQRALKRNSISAMVLRHLSSPPLDLEARILDITREFDPPEKPCLWMLFTISSLSCKKRYIVIASREHRPIRFGNVAMEAKLTAGPLAWHGRRRGQNLSVCPSPVS